MCLKGCALSLSTLLNSIVSKNVDFVVYYENLAFSTALRGKASEGNVIFGCLSYKVSDIKYDNSECY